ncbi:MAG: bifunctional DNA-formamidopyrimidine glycosylase/DNA-(apurinic or apyrimidinic site) lyase [Betaproteobacteria bacterium]|nr:bifunctional DNA-formamidopyrimidine glycosylase/DNA-(apurinic or apyrimidinic site) lyase [Betaproteobacteria bacterium]NBU48723.1 bifunctional DNA-formamidopyrimidine glycosylase/DNA-(apurinic or apyrimidinic site) lyase [Betaproteobacteria bacterium]
MPELPEVEVTRQTLAPALQGARIVAVELGKPLRWPLGVDPGQLRGCFFGPLARRGKYLWMPLHRGPSTPEGSAIGAGGLLVHLGMSGSLGFTPDPAPDVPPGPHEHVRVRTDRGVLGLTDPRRFGAVVWSPGLDQAPAAKLLSGLGREPDDPQLDVAWFHEQIRRRRAPIKQVLLAGDVVVGAGNIYACEALFDAGIDPRTRAHRLSRPRAARLLSAVRHTLAQALSLGGSTLRDFRDAHGMSGSFQDQARVYGREGLPCLRCATPIRRVVMGQRSTFFCPQCQKR